jgi:hypothetical protein
MWPFINPRKQTDLPSHDSVGLDITCRLARNPKSLIPLYKQYREKGTELNSAILNEIPKNVPLTAGKTLGLARGKTFVFEAESESSILMDYCIYNCPWDGKYAFEWYLERHKPPPDSAEYQLLTAMRNARYGIYKVVKIRRGVGAVVEDIFRGENMFIIDIGLSRHAIKGLAFAGRLIAPENRFFMTTGAMIPLLDEKALMAIFEFLSEMVPTPDHLKNLSREQLMDISTFIIRTMLRAGAAGNILYQTTPGVALQPEPVNLTPAAPSPSAGPYPGTARNAPCPCGSGKKHKKCCLGKE